MRRTFSIGPLAGVVLCLAQGAWASPAELTPAVPLEMEVSHSPAAETVEPSPTPDRAPDPTQIPERRPLLEPEPQPTQGQPMRPSPQAATKSTVTSPVQVQAKVSDENPTFGDSIQLEVKLVYPEGYRVFFPAKPALAPFLFDPTQPGSSSRSEAQGTVTETITLELIAARAGLLRTPTIEVPWHSVNDAGGAGDSGTVSVPSQRVIVRSQFAAETEVSMAPLPPPLPLIEENTPLKVVLLVAAMMALAAILTILGLRIYRHRAALGEVKPHIPPHVLALGRLEAIDRSGRLAQDEPRLVIGELSEILREYLGGRYRLHALDMTSTELLSRMGAVDLRSLQLDEIRGFTEESDLVKFARAPASEDDLRRLLGFVRSAVERTMQTQQELDRLRQAEMERLARRRRLRVQVMAPLPLRTRAFTVDTVLGAGMTTLCAWIAIDGQNQGLFDAAYGLFFVWLATRDALGGASPGKTLLGLQIASAEVESPKNPKAWHPSTSELEPELEGAPTAQLAPFWHRLRRNLLLAVPGAGVVAEGLTTFALPEQRRLGDQWASTRVIDARYGLRKGKPSWWPAWVLGILTFALLMAPLFWLGGRPL